MYRQACRATPRGVLFFPPARMGIVLQLVTMGDRSRQEQFRSRRLDMSSLILRIFVEILMNENGGRWKTASVAKMVLLVN